MGDGRELAREGAQESAAPRVADSERASGQDNTSGALDAQQSSGAEPSAGTGATPAAAPAATTVTRAQVLSQLAADNRWIQHTLLPNMALSSNPTVRNTASYCFNRSGSSGQPRVVLSPIAPTHDSATRVTAARQNPAQKKAWVWGTSYTDGSSAGIRIMTNFLGGLHSGNRIGLVITRSHGPRTTFPEAKVSRFLVHEVQHDADHHGGISESVPSGSSAGTWASFKTEFRSYWVDARYSAASDTDLPGGVTRSVDIGGNATIVSATNARALAIKEHILGGSAYAAIGNLYRSSRTFKGQVDGHNHVDSANVTNDPRIDDFLRSIDDRRTGALARTWTALSRPQKASMRGNAQARLLVTSKFDARSAYRLPLLGLLDGGFTVTDYRNAQAFLAQVRSGNSATTRSLPATMSSRSKSFIRGHSDFGPFADHWTSIMSGHIMYAAAFNRRDLLTLLGASPPAPSPAAPLPYPRGCFVAGTPVLLASGESRVIEAVKAGDRILAWSEDQRRVVARPVLATHEHPESPLLALRVEGVDSTLRVTAGHRFFVRGQWVAAGELAVGAELLRYDPTIREAAGARVLAVSLVEQPAVVYNLTVDADPSYFVAGLLVHNVKM